MKKSEQKVRIFIFKIFKDAMNKIVKKNSRRDKRAFADQLARDAEEAANKRDMGALHMITRRLCGALSYKIKKKEEKSKVDFQNWASFPDSAT